MPNIDTIHLRCTSPAAQRAFYRETLGMVDFGDDKVGFDHSEAKLAFQPSSTPYEPGPHDLYWKVAIAVPNIELAYDQLTSRGVCVSTPQQFQDVGFLAHFKDPEGFNVELLDHWFLGQRQEEPIDPQKLGGGAHLNLLTLRASDIERAKATCGSWGMRLLSIQPVRDVGFTLYFYAFTQEAPPSSDPFAVENRSWVYRRPYTVLEVQHLDGSPEISRENDGRSGYAGATIRHAPEPFDGAELFGFVAARVE
jgi:predicted enzyme related to lactoylglutathione lyase